MIRSGFVGGGAVGDFVVGYGSPGSSSSEEIQYPIPKLEIALTDPLSSIPEWVDITQWCKGIDTTYGRQHELQQIEAQTIAAVMDNVTGLFSSYNFQSPFTNLLSYIDSTLVNGLAGSWEDNGSPKADVGTGGIDSTPTLVLTPHAVGTTTYHNGNSIAGGADVADLMTPVTGGHIYTAFCTFRQCGQTGTDQGTVELRWFTATGIFISTSAGSATNLAFNQWVKCISTAQAPSNAALCEIGFSYTTALNTSSAVVQRFGITKRYTDMSSGYILDCTAWGPGGFALTPGKPLHLTGTFDEITNDVAYGYLESLVPTIDDELRKQETINAADAFKFFTNGAITSSLFPGLVVLNGAVLYWRLGEPAPYAQSISSTRQGSVIAADFSRQGNLGVVVNSNSGVPGSSVIFGQPGCLNQDEDTAALITGTGVIVNGITGGQSIVDYFGGASAQIAFKCATAPTSDSLIATANPSIGIRTTGHAYVSTIGGSANGTTNVCDGDWHLLIATYNATSGKIVIYVDGVQQATSTATTGLIPLQGFGTYLMQVLGYGTGIVVDEVAGYPLELSAVAVADLWDLMVAGFTIPGGETTSDVLVILFLLSAGFPLDMISAEVGLSSLICPSVTIGSTTLISVLNQIVASEQGLLYQDRSSSFVFLNRHYAIQATAATVVNATFENSADSDNFYLPDGFEPGLDDSDLWNDVPTQTQGQILHDVKDINSIARSGPRTLQGYTSMLYANDVDTVALGQWLLSAYSTPYTRIRHLTVSSISGGGAGFSALLQRDLIDLIGVIYHPQDAGDDFDQEAQIESIKTSIRPGPKWDISCQLTPYIFGSTSWFTLNDAVLGVLAGLGSDAQNRLAF